MSSGEDPLASTTYPDRVFYAEGVLLSADDFQAEQVYHRGRLARVLAGLHGSGTVAGLRVVWRAPVSTSPESGPQAGREEELLVEPGLAIDRLGRIIELPRAACIRLGRWFDGQSDSQVERGFHGGADAVEVDGAPVDGIVADVFVRFVACQRGKTPAFASGPFDALDAVVPSRLRDGYELRLFIRQERPLPLPEIYWPADQAGLLEAVFGAWEQLTERGERGELKPLREHVLGQDTTSVFLARLVLPAQRVEGRQRPARRVGEAVRVRNDLRPIVYSAAALARLGGL
jgi:hypothetical protein